MKKQVHQSKDVCHLKKQVHQSKGSLSFEEVRSWVDLMGKNNRQIGSKYEQLAADYLKKQGYCIVERNYYTPYGEIDIIAKQDEVLVFVEIKYRSNRRYGAATDAVDHRKQWRISKSAMYYYAYHGYEEQRPCRFDVITVQGSAVTHIQDAFDYCG